ncbi:hypothetical protein J7T55_008970 [Diaporthe amygdali]|uniref:uncharacterized protein n=1 Tax=Phomopsis amygdali TaxID=1214568 RepID=UPI0022FE8D25|nr:uncharacterized protein J7T55_008970 [Diaporthe amygdali]KAJ0100709.1 hypothetical protein J7T55_008970 [Diaporthe amygdali]
MERGIRPSTFNHYFNANLQKKRNDRLLKNLKSLSEKVTYNSGKSSEYSVDYIAVSKLKGHAADKDNAQQVREDILDTLTSYYKVSRKRFVDAICQQVVNHFLLEGDQGPLKILGPDLINSLEPQELEFIAVRLIITSLFLLSTACSQGLKTRAFVVESAYLPYGAQELYTDDEEMISWVPCRLPYDPLPPHVCQSMVSFSMSMRQPRCSIAYRFVILWLCVKHVRRFTEALVLSEQDSQDISPAASGLRRRRASFTDADGNHAYRRIRVDEQSYNQGSSAITIAQQSRPTHDRVGDEAFRKQVLHQLEIKRRQAVSSSRGEMRDDQVYNILLERGSRSTFLEFLSSRKISIGWWLSRHHPLVHTALCFNTNLCTNLRERWESASYALSLPPTLGAFLDVRSPLPPSILPSFLDGDNCQLLSRMRDAVQAVAEAEGPTRPGQVWRETSEWVLLSEGGHNTVPHIDSHGFSTWITAQEGCIGFGWMSRPTRGEYRDWMLNPTAPHRDSRWRYVVLRPGWTVFSPSGTIHFLFRPEGVQTLALGGHILQWTGISLWLDVVGEQLKYAGATGEDVGQYAKSISVVMYLVLKKVKSGGPDELGGKEELQKIRNHMTAIRTSTAGLGIPSRIEEELMRLLSGSVHFDQDAEHA